MKKLFHLWPKLLITAALVFLLYAALYLVHVPCFFRELTGLPCPACGLTRAWLALFRGEIGQAFAMHPMFWGIPILYILFLTDGKLFGHKALDRSVLCLLVSGFLMVFVCRLLVPAWRV